MRRTMRSPFLISIVLIAVLISSLLSFAPIPAYADGDSPADPTPSSESSAPAEDSQAEPSGSDPATASDAEAAGEGPSVEDPPPTGESPEVEPTETTGELPADPAPEATSEEVDSVEPEPTEQPAEDGIDEVGEGASAETTPETVEEEVGMATPEPTDEPVESPTGDAEGEAAVEAVPAEGNYEAEDPTEPEANEGPVAEPAPGGDEKQESSGSDEGSSSPEEDPPTKGSDPFAPRPGGASSEELPVSDPDPYYTLGGVTYRFASGATYCDDNHPGDPNCNDGLSDPVQSAINDLSGRGTPDDGTVYVEDGNYNESVVVDGSAWSSTPSSLTLQSENGSGLTTLLGLTVQNMLDFILRGFTVTNGISATGNTGSLTLADVIASNTSGTGVSVSNHDGDVELESVQANGNANNGASIDNTAGSGDVTVVDGQFNDNNTVAGSGQQAGLEVDSSGTVTLENVEANRNLDGDGAAIRADTVEVSGGSFNDNISPAVDYGNGIAARSSGGPITISEATASGNEESGALLWYQVSAADPANEIAIKHNRLKNNGAFGAWAQPESGTVILKCNSFSSNALGATMIPVGETVLELGCRHGDEDEEHEGLKHGFVGVMLSEEEAKIVNATNGVLVTFPPIKILDPEELPIGKVTPLKKHQLPGEVEEADEFKAGVEVEMINAEFVEGLEDGDLLIEFFIPGYLVDREFSVLWWDLETGEWVEVPHEFVPHTRVPGGKIIARWPETGTFILVMHPLASE